MNENPQVLVLMSSYNGAKYIREQIDSILNQENVNIKICIRDDGSTDSTLDIIKEFTEKGNVELIVDGDRVGPGESFMRLLYSCSKSDADYFAFSDQDDVWLKNKLKVAIDKMASYGEDEPVLYSSNQILYKDGKQCGLRHEVPQRIDLISHITRNTISGCTFVMNKELAELIGSAKHIDERILRCRLHDSLVMLVAIVKGKVVYDEKAYMLYRIHDTNVVGIKKDSLSKKLKKLVGLIRKGNNANIRMYTAKYLLDAYVTKKNDRYILELFANYQNGIRGRFELAFNKEIRNNCLESKLIFTLKVFLNFV